MTTLLASLLYLAPALLIAAALLRGRYLGERTFTAVVAHARRRIARRPARRHGRARRRRTRPPRGGRLVAARMAGRAPPLAA
ncbi:hypothetical protein VSS74_24520 [Conexibacter stalactiti]|uniref:Uncharacterized protein n=1 Tax=Conexibacter stalactiti TaxID=1940611 RepID=A0ABU4HW34_9ACTN|nr:hypothetical protein [Conexibacter stalactiti]MDW5597537.1 hypothetical protein [Conexibacter stalactiti]MEC5038179.1 hypothetical protein [Conexibacter stalactiti]